MTGRNPRADTKFDYSPDVIAVEYVLLAAPGKAFADVGEVDRAGVTIAVARNASADVFLSRSLKSAELLRVAGGVDNVVELLRDGKADFRERAQIAQSADSPAAQGCQQLWLRGQGFDVDFRKACGFAPGWNDGHAAQMACSEHGRGFVPRDGEVRCNVHVRAAPRDFRSDLAPVAKHPAQAG